MSNQIPGVPEGWELVHANRTAKHGEYYIDRAGSVIHHLNENETSAVYPIIRKIEKPARYRQFANAEEFKPHRDRWLTRKATFDSGPLDGAWRVCSYDDDGVWWANARKSTYKDEFNSGRCFDDDGTPFGVRIDE